MGSIRAKTAQGQRRRAFSMLGVLCFALVSAMVSVSDLCHPYTSNACGTTAPSGHPLCSPSCPNTSARPAASAPATCTLQLSKQSDQNSPGSASGGLVSSPPWLIPKPPAQKAGLLLGKALNPSHPHESRSLSDSQETVTREKISGSGLYHYQL